MTPEFRRDPLHDTWVAFAPKRQRRPQEFGLPTEIPKGHLDPFAAGNERLTPPEVFALRDDPSRHNEPGWRVRVVPNRYPAMEIEGPLVGRPVGLYDHLTGIGAHEIVVETPDDRRLEELSVPGITDVLVAWRDRINDLDRDTRFQHIYIFKNVGAAAGASMAHAHSQIVALPVIPPLIEGKLRRARAHYETKQRSLFADILHTEREDGSRLVAENDSFILFCPYASRFPFELAIFPKRHHPDYGSCAGPELQDLAEVLRFALQRVSSVLQKPGYNLLLHTAPLRRRATDRFESTRDDYSWHIEITPRFNPLAGFEVGLGSYINTVFPEEAARYLRGEAKA